VQIRKAFQNAVQRLNEADIPQSELEVSLLLSHALKMKRTTVLLAGERDLNGAQLEKFEKNVARRLAREPLAYITGEKEFWSLSFMVTSDVLIPRPETEFLLEKTLEVIKNSGLTHAQTVKVLDLGTGSGVLAIVLAQELVTAKVTALDYSFNALKVARYNAKKHQVAEKINFINCNWFDGILPRAEFDIVISNPPYIAEEVFLKPFGRTTGSLQPEVGQFEPRLALDGGERGIREISRIAVAVRKVLKPCALFFMEIGEDQHEEVVDIFQRTAAFDSIEIFNDYAGLPRVFQARKKAVSSLGK
jgi:release factor glutamine methyltransferase